MKRTKILIEKYAISALAGLLIAATLLSLFIGPTERILEGILVPIITIVISIGIILTEIARRI